MLLSSRFPFALASALAALAFSTASGAETTPTLPAFPGAEGFGALVTGGRNGAICHVTTLADEGPGSFRDAVSQPNRFVVFDVSGVIQLKSAISVASDITVAGQTAPGEGICLYGGSISLSEQHNIILRYLRCREGIAGDRGKKSLGISKAFNIIVDHCSLEWGRWDNLGITVGSHDVTIQNCLIAEAIHPQSFGALIDSVTNVTLSHNLWMSNESRNPKAKGAVQYINNVVYDWLITGLCGGHSAADHALDVINNYFIAGPSSNEHFAGQFLPTDHVYQTGNYVDLDRNGALDGHVAKADEFHGGAEEKYSAPTFVAAEQMHPPIPVTTESAGDAYHRIVATVGCSLRRDAVDQRLITELQSLGKQGHILPHKNEAGEALVGGQPPYPNASTPIDADHDGIPDAWEKAHGLDPQNSRDAATVTPSGYTQLEMYVNGFAGS